MHQHNVRQAERAFRDAFDEYMETARDYGTTQILDTCAKRLEELGYSQDALDALQERDKGLQDEMDFTYPVALNEAQEALHNIWLMEYGSRSTVQDDGYEYTASEVLSDYRDELRTFNQDCDRAQRDFEQVDIPLPD